MKLVQIVKTFFSTAFVIPISHFCFNICWWWMDLLYR